MAFGVSREKTLWKAMLVWMQIRTVIMTCSILPPSITRKICCDNRNINHKNILYIFSVTKIFPEIKNLRIL